MRCGLWSLLWWCASFWLAVAGLPVQAEGAGLAAKEAARGEVVHFAVLAFRPKPEMLKRWQPVADYLDRALPGQRVVLEALDYPELEAAVRAHRVDLVLTQPAHYVALSAQQDLYSPLATLVEIQQGQALTHFGGVIVAASQNEAVGRLADLKGKRIAASSTESLGGYQSQAYELLSIGIRPTDYQLLATGKQDAALQAVLEGRADAAFVRTGLLEQMESEGKLSRASFRVMRAETVPTYPLAISTRLYPEWALAAMPWLDPAVAKHIASAALSLSANSEAALAARISGFTIPGDYRSVERLMRSLRVPPYDQRVPLEIIWEDHRTLVVVALAGIVVLLLWSLSVRVRSARQKRLADDQLRQAASVFQHANEGIVITAPDGTVLDVNAAFTRITGYLREDIVGQNPRVLRSGRQGAEFYQSMWQSLLNGGQWSGEVWNRRKDGAEYAELLTISTVYGARGEVLHYIGLFYDITALKEHQLQLEHLAHYDPLTHLPNRMLLADRMQQAINQAQRRRSLIAVAYIDLDGFKAINDTYGHEVGDKLLIQVAGRMKDSLRDGDTLSRLGGDEFVAVLLDLDSHADSVPILDRLLVTAAWPVSVGDLELRVSASIGVTYYPQMEEMDADQLLRQADQAMYQAKQGGRNRYNLFDDQRDRALRGHREGIERIREALANQEFVLHYQPKVNLRTGEVIGAEALIRWQHPEHGLLPPAAFLPAIEEDELIKLIGDWVIENALCQMEQWHQEGLDMPVSVNVAARQLQAPEFLGKLRVALHLHPSVAHNLQLEVLESSALEDIEHATQVINACRDMNVSFALDDFGTGYSSLTYLKNLPAQALKIDQSFVRNMLEDQDDLAILDGIVGMAEAFQRQAIAEGVETEEHGRMLLRLGCQFGQGYAIARPMPAGNIAAWATDWGLRGLPGESTRISREQLPLMFAMVEHRAWVTGLGKCLGDPHGAPDLHDAACRFGQWLDGPGARVYGGHPSMPRVLELHQQLHQLGEELMHLRASRGALEEGAWKARLEKVRDEFCMELLKLAGIV